MKYVRYESVGNTVGLENGIDDYWEIDATGYVERSIQVELDGTQLKYDRSHEADPFGQLPEGIITNENLADKSVGKITEITREDFEIKWAQKAKNRDEYPS